MIEPPLVYKLRPDELKAIKECSLESFYQRSLPLSALLGVGTYLAINTGFLKPNPKLGAFPKVGYAIAIGFFIGKFSYQGKCAEKLLQLPNSELGELLFHQRRSHYQESDGYGSGRSLPRREKKRDSESDQEGKMVIIHDEAADSSNFFVDDFEKIAPEERPRITYEELRKKNRQEYQLQGKKGTDRLSDPSTSETEQILDEPEPLLVRTNKYGDTWG